MPSIRGATEGPDAELFKSEAFVFRNRHEKIPVIYIESAFFNGNNILTGRTNWARIILHECTHLDCNTRDVKYAWEGINPRGQITWKEAAVNADSWAYFAADCGGHLTDGDIYQSMGVIPHS